MLKLSIPNTMHTKLFSWLAFTVLSVVQTEFPRSDFVIENVYFPYYASVKNDSTEPGMPLVINDHATQSSYWSYDSVKGNLVNINSISSVLTAPSDDSDRLTIEVPDSTNSKQVWVYQNQNLLNRDNMQLCVTIDLTSPVGFAMRLCDGATGQKFNLVPKAK
ncbi:hypothetical protein D9756_007146 [Leucocoprinus leucothites]|uniref:Ricin B lectin domain-containing protein n=1 Tax=Leucocoprinus leucothites TaxID=201217 RepID=A0A8H5D5P9_9AGAR|nr:hypothetical protein D9756_007146 [Leucoagaricus leucothites]